MARTPRNDTDNAASGGYALLDFGSMSIVLPADMAAQAFSLLCRGEVVEYSWGSKTYNRITDASRAPTLRVFSAVSYAQLALEEPQ